MTNLYTARNLLVKMNTVPVEQIATMTELDIYEAILEKYELIISDGEDVLLIEKDKLQGFNKIAVWLSR